MNPLNYISDEEFLPFLQNLEVESDRKSFEWMFNDPELSGILQWLYNSLDHSNALSAREKYRYAEIEQHVLSPEDLESYIASLQEEYQGLCLPGDQESVLDAKMDVRMQNERLKMLERQENVIRELVKQNDLAKEELSREITKLNSAQHQLVQDEAASAEECLALAGELESLTESVVDVIADSLSLYTSAHTNKEIAKKFLYFGPFESYKQAQALFRSHFDLYVSRKLSKRQSDAVTDGDLRCALVEASVMGDRLTNAAFTYIDSKTELAGEQAKLALVANYQNVHPSRVAHLSLEEQAALDVEQEEPILDQQVQDAVKEYVDGRTKLAAETAARSALAVRERIHSSLTYLRDVCAQALRLDRALLSCARAAWRASREFLELSSQLQEYYAAEGAAAARRIKSMNEICLEQGTCQRRLDSSDDLLDSLRTILGVKSNDAAQLSKAYCELKTDIEAARDSVCEGCEGRERAIDHFFIFQEIAKKFLNFGPFESYKQAQALFRSHFDLYVSRKLSKRQSDAVTDGDLRCALVEASVMGDRLTNAAFTYIDAKTELAGEQAKLALVANYQNVHPSRVAHLSLEEQAALDMEQEEPILDQQVQDAVKEYVDGRIKLAAETAARSALAVRERVHSSLTHLRDVCAQALRLERALLSCARAAWRASREFLELSSQLQEYYAAEGAAAARRIKSMNEICLEQGTCQRRLDSSDDLLDSLRTILGVKSNDAAQLSKAYCELKTDIEAARDSVCEGCERRERAIDHFKSSTLPLRQYIWDGCTKLPNCWNTSVAAMTHSLKQEMEQVERKVAEASGVFSSVKNGDKQGLRKLWQYFLTDQNKLAATMRAAQSRSYP